MTAVPAAATTSTAGWSAPAAFDAAPARYAGFWRRFWAWIIDGVLLGCVMWPVRLALGAPFYFSPESIEDLSQDEMVSKLGVILIAGFINLLVSWIYFALFHSSSRQATPGMMALGLRIFDLQGQRISFSRASLRFLGSLVSAMVIFIGYLMILFTEKKQALHDMMAGTVVRR